VITLQKLWPEQFVDGKETIALRTLEDMAHRGELPGAFRPPKSRKWWIKIWRCSRRGRFEPKNVVEISGRNSNLPHTIPIFRPDLEAAEAQQRTCR